MENQKDYVLDTARKEEDGTSSKLLQAAGLVGEGFAGAGNSLVEHTGTLALQAGAAFALTYGLARVAPGSGLARFATLAAPALILPLAKDVTLHGAQGITALQDAFGSGHNYEQDKLIARKIGAFALDFGVAAAAGYAGARMGRPLAPGTAAAAEGEKGINSGTRVTERDGAVIREYRDGFTVTEKPGSKILSDGAGTEIHLLGNRNEVRIGTHYKVTWQDGKMHFEPRTPAPKPVGELGAKVDTSDATVRRVTNANGDQALWHNSGELEVRLATGERFSSKGPAEQGAKLALEADGSMTLHFEDARAVANFRADGSTQIKYGNGDVRTMGTDGVIVREYGADSHLLRSTIKPGEPTVHTHRDGTIAHETAFVTTAKTPDGKTLITHPNGDAEVHTATSSRYSRQGGWDYVTNKDGTWTSGNTSEGLAFGGNQTGARHGALKDFGAWEITPQGDLSLIRGRNAPESFRLGEQEITLPGGVKLIPGSDKTWQFVIEQPRGVTTHLMSRPDGTGVHTTIHPEMGSTRTTYLPDGSIQHEMLKSAGEKGVRGIYTHRPDGSSLLTEAPAVTDFRRAVLGRDADPSMMVHKFRNGVSIQELPTGDRLITEPGQFATGTSPKGIAFFQYPELPATVPDHLQLPRVVSFMPDGRRVTKLHNGSLRTESLDGSIANHSNVAEYMKATLEAKARR